MRIAIIGSGGRLGAALARVYGKEHELLPLDRKTLDIGSEASIREALEPCSFDLAINCAALTNVDYCETHEEEAMRVNSEAVGVIAGVCLRKKARLIHISTDYVFDGLKRSPYEEEDKPHAIGVYGLSKQHGEQELLDVCDKNVAVRVSWVFGPDRPSFIDGILARAAQSESVSAIADKYSAPAYTLDIAEALRPLFSNESEGGFLHVCNSGACTWQEYGQYAIDCAVAAGMPIKGRRVDPVPMSEMASFVAKRPVYTVLSTEKLARLSGAAPRLWQSAVQAYVESLVRTAKP